MIHVNLLPVREVAREAGRRQQVRLVGLCAVLVAVVLVSIETSSRLRLIPIRAEHAQLQSELQALAAKTKELDELQRQRAELDEKLETIKVLEERRIGPMQILADLSDATPEQVWLLEFTENRGAATITGMALDNQTIAVFMRRLDGSPYFAAVDLVETTQSELDGVQLQRFVVRARLNYTQRETKLEGEGGDGAPAFPKPPKAPGRSASSRRGGRA